MLEGSGLAGFFSKPLIRRVVFILAVLFFISGIVFSVYSQPELISNINAFPVMVILALCVPFTILQSIWELQLTVRLLGRRISFYDAMSTTVLAIAANMLPLPGNVMVKVSKFKSLGVTYKSGISITLLTGLFWLGCAFVYGGLWLLYIEYLWLGAFLLFGGIGITAVTSLVMNFLYKGAKLIFYLIVGRFLFIGINAVRLYLCFSAFGVDVDFSRASILTIAPALAAVVAFVPSGLGVAEALASGLGGMIDVSSASSYLATALNRVLGLVFLAFLAALIFVFGRFGKEFYGRHGNDT